jgi:GTP-binding protein
LSNIVAIVGRPNVGKSTLFNRLVERRQAIMDNESGVTRDRHYGIAEWNGRTFTVIDTGGYVVGSEDVFEAAIREQVALAVQEAQVVVLMVDCHTGLTDLDKDFAKVLRSSNKPVVIAANKADNADKAYMASEFYSMGLGEVFPIAAASGSGTGELLDEVIKHLTPEKDVQDPALPRITILGRPNVGKSSFLNVLLGIERTIVTDMAGTTRDAIDTRYNMFGKDFIITDTAGLRKKSRVKDNIEFYSVLRSVSALEDSDVCIIMLDAERGLESQDQNIIGLAHRKNKGIVILVNKWDLVEKDHKTAEVYRKAILDKLSPLTYIPIVFTSTISKQRIFKAMELALEVYENRQKRISTSALNNKLLPEIEKRPPPSVKGKYIKIKYITQLPARTPAFALFCNLPQYIKEPYKRFIENKLRMHFDFTGVPIRLFFRRK